MGGITKMCMINLSTFSTTCRCIGQRCKKCMSWHFIAWSIQNWATQPLWDNGTMRQQASHMCMVCSSKNTYMFLIFCHSEMRLIPIESWHSWTKWQILCLTTVNVPSHQYNDIQWYFCTVLLTYCVAAWTDCSLYDSVQKYCCTQLQR